jgi:hypothetical protein
MHDVATPTGEVHPAADLFPMLPDDELAELAADIGANGLIHPIVLDADGRLIDGRNRLAACRAAGIEPTFTTLNGHDPIAYIISANVRHRHLTRSQQAMAVAMAKLLDSNDLMRGEIAKITKDLGVNQSLVSQAFVVAEYASDLGPEVMAKTVRLDVAYEEAKRRRDLADSFPERARREAEERLELLAKAPELLLMVDDGTLTHTGAMAELRAREQRSRENAIRHTKTLWNNLTGIWTCLVVGPDHWLDGWMPAERGLDAEAFDHLLTADGIRELGALVSAFAEAVDERGGLDGGA